LLKYIQESANRKQSIHGVPVSDQINIGQRLNLSLIKDWIEANIPRKAFNDIIEVCFTNEAEYNERMINAYYDRESRCIFLSDKQENEKDCINDIVHELSHALQERYGQHVFMDGELKKEFVSKRMKMASVLHRAGYDEIPRRSYAMVEYSNLLDEYFFNIVGYQKINSLLGATFPSAYACTSLEEYYAEGFEAYYCKENGRSYLKKYCPVLFAKLSTLEKELYK
jgi:hypothetical protein